jgi:4-amino-4-deoxy-L-arabinose transferase-like glycosyltransferase
LKHVSGIRFLPRGQVLRLLVLGFLFVAAFGLRLYGINQHPVQFGILRHYHGALLARGFYEWLLSGDLKTVPPDGIIEPPILELLASFAYLIFGGEHLWIPQLLSAVFWMVGGVFLYLIAKRIVSPNAAVFSVFFYLFVPYSVFASRIFMPDPLMVMLLVISVFTILKHHEQPSTRRLMVAATASSLAIFVKPGICLFQVFGAFVSLAVYREGVRRSLVSPQFLVFAVLSILPTGLYYLYGTFLAGFLRGQTSQKVVPQLVLETSFWKGWLLTVSGVLGYVALLGALFGVLLLRKGLPRVLMIGLWSGYFLFGLTFTSHIATHDYYSLQLIPVVALSLGPLADLIMNDLKQTVNNMGQLDWRGYGRIVFLALCISVLVLSAVGNRQTSAYSTTWMTTQQDRAASYLATFREIGEVVNHSRRTLVLFGGSQSGGPNYGFALMYHGRLLGETWPYPTHQGDRQEEKRGISTEELFSRRYRKHSPEYFVISRGWWVREETTSLRTFLTENFPVAAQGDTYVVFDLRRNLDPRGESR